MTIRVTIEHTQPGYEKAITVEEVTVDINGDLKSRDFPGYKTVVQPGGKLDKYVYSAQALIITEGPAAQPQPPENAQ
jgi:hypothetical protein